MKPLPFIVIALATWRLSAMLVSENGPSYIFERMRHRLGIRRKKDNPSVTYAENPESFVATLFLCVWCLSVWIAAIFAALHMLNRKMAERLAMPFALSAIACLLDWMSGWSDR